MATLWRSKSEKKTEWTFRTPADFPDYAEAAAKLQDLENQYHAADAEFRAEKEKPRASQQDRFTRAAQHLLDGTVEETTQADLDELHRRSEVLRIAANLQREIVDRKQREATVIIGKEAQPAHRELIAKFLKLQQEAFDAYQAVLDLRQAGQVACGIEALPLFLLRDHETTSYKTAVKDFAGYTETYLKTGEPSIVG